VRWAGQITPQISGDQVFKLRADGGVRLFVNGQKLIDSFNNPPVPPVGYGPTPAFVCVLGRSDPEVDCPARSL
jgi:beta-glucosidase